MVNGGEHDLTFYNVNNFSPAPSRYSAVGTMLGDGVDAIIGSFYTTTMFHMHGITL